MKQAQIQNLITIGQKEDTSGFQQSEALDGSKKLVHLTHMKKIATYVTDFVPWGHM